MITTEREDRALEYVKNAHGSQRRKYLDIPYWTHVIEVSEICRTAIIPYQCHDSEDIYVAALAHDLLEDTLITEERLEKDWGSSVTELVIQLTDPSRPEDGNREQRKLIDREHYIGACPCSQTIKLADLISNTQSILAFDRNFAKMYLREKQLLLPLLKNGAPELLEIANNILIKYNEFLKEEPSSA